MDTLPRGATPVIFSSLPNRGIILSFDQGSKLQSFTINSLVPETKIAEFVNSIVLDEVAHYEPPHQDLCCFEN